MTPPAFRSAQVNPDVTASMSEETERDAAASVNVAIIYTHLPHYREAVFKRLLGWKRPNFTIYTSRGTLESTIKSFHGADIDDDSRLIKKGPFVWQTNLWRVVLGRREQVLVFLGNPYILSTWLYALVARLFTRKVVLYWTHGWTRESEGLKGAFRSIFYRLANGLLLYGERAKRVGLDKGFPSDSLFVIYNSLDYETQRACRDALAPPAQGAHAEPYFVAIGRLVPELALHVAIDALAILRKVHGASVPLVVVGDGPERAALEARARAAGVDARFLGAMYDEAEIAPILAGAVATVSPGKVGLAAMHSLAYGTPVITHGDPDFQMPEYEAIRPGMTGEVFDRGDAASMAQALQRRLERPRRGEERRLAIGDIERSYTPEAQCRAIERAIARFAPERA
jgi:glycosyltransferase involved in cell wall biosynthesis